MGLTSVDGLVSGLDTTTIITQLMALERRPVDTLTARKATYDAKATAWDTIGAKIAALRTALEALDSGPDLRMFKISSSDSEVLTASAGASAVRGTLSLTVQHLARAHQLVSTGFDATTSVVGTGTFWVAAGLDGLGGVLTVDDDYAAGAHTLVVRDAADGTGQEAVLGGVAVAISPDTGGGQSATFTDDNGKQLKVSFASAPVNGTATLAVANLTSSTATVSELAAKISVAGGPARAQVINVGGDSGARLIVTAAKTGAANALTWNWSGSPGITLEGPEDLTSLDAAVDIPGVGIATRPSNTITDLVPGLTLNLLKEDAAHLVSVEVAPDTDGVVAKVRAFVDALNDLVKTIQSSTRFDAATKKSGALTSDATARSLQSSLVTAAATVLPSGAYTFFSELGVSITRDGSYTLDEAKLRTALDSDFDSAAQAVNALTSPVFTWVRDNDALSGTVSRAKDAAKSASADIEDQIDAYGVRLTAKEERYRKQFTALEAALGQLKSQSSWLAGQIASLPSYKS
jgi:flagellar hook-associated protein 2